MDFLSKVKVVIKSHLNYFVILVKLIDLVLLHMKTIHKIFISAFINIASAQKLERPIIDKFNNDTTLSSTSERIYASTSPAGGVNVAIKKISKSYILALEIIQVNGLHNISIEENAQASFKFADNSILNIPASKAANSTEKLYPGGNQRSELTCYYILTKSDLDKLKTGEISIVRVLTSKGNFDYELKDKFKSVIKNEAILF
jgi:hypothetical protein